MVERFRYKIRPDGLGLILTQMSFLLAMGKPVTAVVSHRQHLCFHIKRIFRIHDKILTIEVGSEGHEEIASDELCTYAPYLTNGSIELYGREFTTEKTKKPCVALAMHHGSGLGENLSEKYMPYNKFASADEYQQVWRRLSDMGYDVIAINSRQIDVEQKTYLLNELCEFVIGYEGGLHHLAHCLKVPCIILPWKYNDMGHPPVYPGMYFETHRFHADRKTWFLHTVDEFMSMPDQQIKELVIALHNDQGNNILFSPGVFFEPETLTISHPTRDLTPRLCWCETHGPQTVDFIKTHLPLDNMVQYQRKQSARPQIIW